MHKFCNNQLPEILLILNFTDNEQIHSYPTRLSCNKNCFLSQYCLKQSQSQTTYLDLEIWVKIPDQIKNYPATLSLRNFEFIFKMFLLL